MERLILLLLSPAIFAERHKANDPNDEPFLPIYPVYPYNPKLIKRGTERELISHLTPELYAPKVESKDAYSTGYSNSNNYQRETYYNPDDNPYPKSTSPSSSTYSSYYNGDGYAYANLPYVAYNSYTAPYTVNPTSYPASTYPDYYYQPPYYYPHYFNHALFPPPPAPPSSGVDYRETSSSQDSETTGEAEEDKQDKDKKSNKSKEDETNRETSTSQFVDGGNYISGNSRDLDGQSSTYKVASPYNQVERNVHVKNLPIPLPKTTYRVISVAGQPVGPDYPLPATYVKAQQMEQLMSQTLAKLLTQNSQQQAGQSYESTRGTVNSANDGSYANQQAYNTDAPSYVTVPGVRTKTGVVYVINSDSVAKVNGERSNSQDSPSPPTPNKNVKYSNVLYVQKPVSQTTPEHSQTTYVLTDERNKQRDQVSDSQPADQIDEYESYDASQSYDGALSQSESKQERDYSNYQSQSSGSYRNKDFITASQTPRSYTYQYSAYESDQATSEQPQQDKITSDDGNFGAKQYNKG